MKMNFFVILLILTCVLSTLAQIPHEYIEMTDCFESGEAGFRDLLDGEVEGYADFKSERMVITYPEFAEPDDWIENFDRAAACRVACIASMKAVIQMVVQTGQNSPEAKAYSSDGYYGQLLTKCRYSRRDFSDMEHRGEYMFNKVLLLTYSSTVGNYTPYTEVGKIFADIYNNKAQLAFMKDRLDSVCKNRAKRNYDNIHDKASEPNVTLKSVAPSSGRYPAMLVCSAYNFFPRHITVTWYRDNEKVTSDVISTEELADGDWNYQIHSHLEYTPKSGEKISCVVEHGSLRKPMVMHWESLSMPVPDIVQYAVGAFGLLLGVIIAVVGIIHDKKKSAGSVITVTVSDDTSSDGSSVQFPL